jgi:serine/threonine protein kinase/Leucine-rich repeat (LRR) protein
MGSALSCPRREDLQRLIQGQLPPSDVDRLTHHLGCCPACTAAMRTLLGNDTLLPAIPLVPADAPAGNAVPADLTQPSSGSSLDFDPASDSSSAISPTLRALKPPQGPGEIGRLAHYRILKVLGAGGMGVVFLAEDVRLSRTVALKTMRPAIAAEPRNRQRFLREARAAAKVESDHIVPVYDVGEDRGVPWLAMPLLKGESLEELLKRQKVLLPAQVVRLGAQVAKGLAVAHAAGLIHRDIKPANIWVEPEGGGRAKLLDFGLARDQSPPPGQGQEPLTQTGAVLGTPAYMAPEQAGAKPLDARADLFSLGCVLYRAVTGRLPFQGEGTLGTLLALATETPPAPDEVNAAVPQRLSALIMNLLAKDRSARPASAATVAAALEAMQDQPAHSVPVARVSRREERNPWADLTEVAEPLAPTGPPRRRWLSVTAAVLVLVLGGALAAGVALVLKYTNDREAVLATVDSGLTEAKPPTDMANRKPDPTDADPDRRAAAWVRSIDGGIRIRVDGEAEERGLATNGTAPWGGVYGGPTTSELPKERFRLTSIGLWGNGNVTDAGLANCEGCKSVAFINLSGAGNMTDAGLKHFREYKNLKEFHAYNAPMGDQGVEALKDCENLNILTLAQTRVSNTGLAHLKRMTKLTALSLFNVQAVNDDGLKHLTGLKNLTSLDLTGTQVTAGGIADLQKALPNCEILSSLDPDRRAATWVRSIDGGVRIRVNGEANERLLFTSGTAPFGTDLPGPSAELPKEPFQLTGIGFRGVGPVTDASLANCEGCKNVVILNLSGNEVTAAGVRHFRDCKNLKHLDLDRTWVGDTGLEHFKDCTNLTYLDLCATRVSNAGLAHLKEMTKLEFLNLSWTSVGDDGLKHLAGLKSLTRLAIDGTKVTRDGVAELQKALPNCKIGGGPAAK